MASKSSTLLRSTFVFSALTTLSRILGYIRDAAIFIIFGAGISTDAFLVAFRLPNFLRRLFGEGALAHAFIPVYQDVRNREGQEKAKELLDYTVGTLSIILSVITIAGILLAPILIIIFAPGFIGKEDDMAYELSSQMLRITFPYLLFISITALLSAVLNSHNIFFATAFSPVLLNLSLIFAAIFLAPMTNQPIVALAWGVLFAGLVQITFQVFWMRYKINMVPKPKCDFYHRGVRRVAKLMTPAILSSTVMQVNLIFDTIIASFLITGSISWLYISDRFVELPLALFGIAISTVILPRLATHYAVKDDNQFSKTMDWGIGSSLILALPCTAGLILLAGPILISLVQYREFSLYDTQMAYLSLAAYATGLPAFMLVKILTAGFYARQNAIRPMRIAIVAMLSNIAMNIIFVLVWKFLNQEAEHVALAVATSLASWLNFILLYRALKKEKVLSMLPDNKNLFIKTISATAVMSIVLFAVIPSIQEWSAINAWWQRVGLLVALVLLGGFTYFISLLALRMDFRKFLHIS